MKSVGEILRELGFNPNAPLETQKAFLRHLVRTAESPKVPNDPVQMSFDPDILGVPVDQEISMKRAGRRR